LDLVGKVDFLETIVAQANDILAMYLVCKQYI
jgi:hypothetical protein